ncbi:hypothetical protein CFC21_074526 [Triticum aestivum]|uniref:Uncharacterized protein n=3 Tax=Triticum aestivum TaxID=4565 RepID=A0A3B6LWM6_WHEAT|nr:hypothetical protein CFC21_074526 [Triticum aestivum]
MEELLGKLRHLAHCAEDLLDELDYFRIHDELHGTYEAADHHAKGGVHDLVLNSRHTVKAVGKLAFVSSRCCWSATSPAGDQVEDARQQVSCSAWPRARKRSHGNSSSASNANQEISGCMPKLGKLLPCSSSPDVPDDNPVQSTIFGAPLREHAEETPMQEFNRAVISERMKCIVEQLQPLRTEFTTILQSCGHNTVPGITHGRPLTTARSIEPKLYGRDQIVKNIIHDITKGKCQNKDLTVLPIVGPGGIGKTALIQHIYHHKDVRNHFQVLIWVCVSLSFNVSKLLEDIKNDIPEVKEEKGGKPDELIEQRLKSKRFLLVLDDIWGISTEDDWEKLLLPLKTSEEKGNMILLTTRFPAVAKMVGTIDHSINLEGLEPNYFRELFHAIVFGDDQCRQDHIFLLETGEKIMVKLKGSPLAAKTVGRLLRKGLNLRHWRKVLESKEWERQTGENDIMTALKLSYDYLPFEQQQCFSYSALFPEDYGYSATELIDLWIGLGILQPDGQNPTLETKGLNNLNDLVTHGFFREDIFCGRLRYVMHDLLHDLALKVASNECLTMHHSTVGPVEIHPSIHHLSIIVDGNDTVSHENFKSQLRKLKTRLKVKQLHTLMLFGVMDEIMANILGDLFREASALRVLCLVNMSPSVESMLHKFPTLIHLRYLRLGKRYGTERHLPLAISRFYHLRILDLRWQYDCRDLLKDLSNLAKLCRFYTPTDELHSDIFNVGKLKLLEELKKFRVNKESEGFEPEQLEHLTELRELGIYNLENIHTKEEAAKAKVIEKNYLERLTLDWDSNRSNSEPDVEAMVLESLQPHKYLKELCIRGHRGPFCPTWLGDEPDVELLQSLHLDDVSWENLPSFGKMLDLHTLILKHIAAMKEFVIERSFSRLIRLELVGLESFGEWVLSQDSHHMFPLLQELIIRDCPNLLELPFSNHIAYPPDQDWNSDSFAKLQVLEIQNCPEFLLVHRIPWTETLHSVFIMDVKLLQDLEYTKYDSKSSKLVVTGKDELRSLDQVLAFNNLTGLECLELDKCPPLELKHIVMLNSVKYLDVVSGDLVGLLGRQNDFEWQLPVEHLVVKDLRGASGKQLTELLCHLPRLSELYIKECKNITKLTVGVDLQQTISAAKSEVEQEKEDDGLVLFPANLSNSLQLLAIGGCPELVLVDPSSFIPERGGEFPGLRSLEMLEIIHNPKILSGVSFSCCFSPSSLQELRLEHVEDMGTLEPLSDLTSLTRLQLSDCGKDLRCKGLRPLLTAGGQLTSLEVRGSPRFFAGWDPNHPSQVMQDGGKEQELQQLQLVSPPSSSKLQFLHTDEAMGLLVVPICSFLSSSLTHLHLDGISQEMERFTKEQEDALHLLTFLQHLQFYGFIKLQSLPSVLHKLTNLKLLRVVVCPAIRSLPEDGLPKSLQELDVYACRNENLKQQCRGLGGTIPKIKL